MNPSSPNLNLSAFINIFAKERQNDIKATLSQFLPVNFIQDICLLHGGYSSSSTYKISTSNDHYVLRVMGLDHDLSDRRNQITCLKKAAELGLAPKCYYSDAELGLIIMDYLSPQPLKFNKNNLSILADVLKKLHDCPLFPPTHMSLFDYLLAIENKIRKSPISPLLSDYFDEIRRVCTILQKHQTVASCHNDLNANNFIFDGKSIYLIDWEAAGACDPYYDLATVCNQLVFKTSDENYFLEHYFGHKLTDYQIAKIFLMKQISSYYYALHFLSFALDLGIDLSEFHVENTNLLSQWSSDYIQGKIGLVNANDFLIFAKTQIKHSLDMMGTAFFKHAKVILG